jgi:hypothetical protein
LWVSLAMTLRYAIVAVARYAIVAVVRRLRGCVCVFTRCCDDLYSNNDKCRTLNREKTAKESLKYTLHACKMATAQP